MKYKIIYADPPWSFKNYSDKWHKDRKGSRWVANHYVCMTKDDIKRLPVQELADKDCILFLWVTAPCLIEGIELCKAWGFTYKTVGFTWIKKNKKADSLFWGMGYWTRSNAEFCLIATKGSPKRLARNVHQVVMSPIEGHSKKPDEVRRRIVSLMGDVPRIELFARQKVEGWDAWGVEVESDVVL